MDPIVTQIVTDLILVHRHLEARGFPGEPMQFEAHDLIDIEKINTWIRRRLDTTCGRFVLQQDRMGPTGVTIIRSRIDEFIVSRPSRPDK